MPKFGRPFPNLEDEMVESSRNRRDYVTNDGQVLYKAPFGTNYTPVVRTKIVGSRYYSVIDDHPAVTARGHDQSHPQYQHPLSPSQQLQVYGNNGRDAESNQPGDTMNRHPVLPPIAPSPYFAPAPPTPTGVTALVSRLDEGQGRSSPPLIPIQPIVLAAEEELDLLGALQHYLRPVPMSRLKEVYLDLTTYADPQMTGFITYPLLQGACQRREVFLPVDILRLVAAMFVASPLGSSRHHDLVQQQKYGGGPLVNYEKVLSFLGAAKKMAAVDERRGSGPLSPHAGAGQQLSFRGGSDSPTRYDHRLLTPNKPVYYHDDRCLDDQSNVPPQQPPNTSSVTLPPPSHSPHRHLSPDRDDPKLVRALEDRLSSHQIPLEEIRFAFQRADRLHRGSLSEQQIKEICRAHRLPVEEDLLEKIVRRCHHRGGGQFDWQQFLAFLERVQPLQTGLFIPSSKMPAEFARPVPQPAASWPHAEAPEFHYGQASPRNNYQDDRSADSPTPLYRQQSNYLNGDSSGDGAAPLTNGAQAQQQMTNDQAQVMSFPRDQRRTSPAQPRQQHQFQEQGQASPISSSRIHAEPWFPRFMKLADTLYRHDVQCLGSLDTESVLSLTRNYNADLDLQLTDADITTALTNSWRRDKTRVDINTYLKVLALRG